MVYYTKRNLYTEFKKETYMKNTPTVCYVAGKSGGHIIPCLTLAHEEKQEHPETRILFFSTNNKLDIDIIKTSPDVTKWITLPLSTVTCTGIFSGFTLACKLIVSTCKLLYYLITQRPIKMVCTGGFIAIPATICARILAIPVELYELNIEPGKAIKFLSSWSVTIKTCFTETQRSLPRKKCIKTAYPIRFFDTRKQMCQKEALEELKLDPARKTITVLGGSQGSLEINNLVHEFIITHPELHNAIQFIHQTGDNDNFNWQTFYAQHSIPARVFNFCSDLAPHYAAADLILCRAGAGTLFEVLFFGKPCIPVPLVTKHNTHQLKNALAMQQEYNELFTTFVASPNMDNNAIAQEIIMRLNLHNNASKSAPEKGLNI